MHCAIALAGCKALCGCETWTSENPCSSDEMKCNAGRRWTKLPMQVMS